LFNHSAKGCLGCLCHHIRFIQNDELEALGEERSCFGKLLDLFADNIYSTVVGSIELNSNQTCSCPTANFYHILQGSVFYNWCRIFSWLLQG
jgi:hypothetical protein